MDILVGVSNRHVHLTREDLNILFGKGYELTVKNYLVQPGQFACNETVSLEANGYRKDFVRIIGPIRKYTQVELLDSDKELFKLDPPVRNSGELDNSESIRIIGPVGSIDKSNCCIIANRHIHCNKLDNIGYNNGDIVKVKYKDMILNDVHIKMDDSYKLEFHINKDDASNLDLNTGDIVVL